MTTSFTFSLDEILIHGLNPNMNGFLAFLMHHEAYHIGQPGILRKYLGKEAMKYN